jgi:oligopeptide transport system substrate-binding protein
MQITPLSYALIAVLALQGCGDHKQSAAPDAAQVRDTLRRGLGAEPSSLDPAKAADSYSSELLRDLYEGLIAQATDGALAPGVAESWDVNDAGTEYQFHLRYDARWSNGEPVKASDFVNAWRRAVDPATGSPAADNFRLIVGTNEILAGRAPAGTLGVSAPRDDLLIVKLDKPAPYFPQLLTHSSTFPIYSKESAESHDPATKISNGAYALSRWTPGNALQLVRNEHYWDRGNVHIAQVDYFPVPDENAEYLRYRAGELDLTENVPLSAVATIRRERPAELHTAPFLATAYYALNLHSGPLMGSTALRQALAMAIDRHALLTLLPFGQRAAFGFVPPGAANYSPQSWDWAEVSDEARIQESKLLYAQAGYSLKKPLHLRLLFNTNTGIKQIAIAVASWWRETLGVDTELIDEEYRVFLQSRHDPKRWEVARLAWGADYNDAGNFLNALTSGSPNNDSGYSSKPYDALLDQASLTPDAQKRRQLLESAEKLMLEDYPIVPLYFYSAHRLMQPYVHGEAPNPLGRLYSKHLTLDP